MATIVYLDADDEITSAASRIRAAAEDRVGLVLPFGSRVATSRINFRLLAREAQASGRRLDIVAPDASARALAASAGLPVFGSVGEYEAALDAEEAGSIAGDVATAAAATGATLAGIAAAGSERETTSANDAPTDRTRGPLTEPASRDYGAPGVAEVRGEPRVATTGRAEPRVVGGRRGGPGKGVLALLLTVLLTAVVGGVAAFVLLPTATITVTPVIETVGPVSFEVTADPDVSVVDPAGGTIPATTLQVPVVVQSEFETTGTRVEETPATGGVRWTNCDPTASYRIPRGTVVRTSGGTAFRTEEAVFLPVAIIDASLDLKCQTSEVAITAAEPGPDGNVDKGAIRVVPARYNRNVIRVTNPAATTGGTREEFPRVSKKDVEAAVAQLQLDLAAQFTAELENPDRIPAGTTVFPETAVLGDAVTTPEDPTTLVGEETGTFALQLSSTGTVQAVDASPVTAIAEQRLAASLDEGYELVDGSTKIDVGEGTVEFGVISFPVTVTAKQVRPVDAAEIEALVLGLPEAEAEAALAPYGDVEIVLWPGYVGSVPSLEQRVTVIVAEPVDPGGDPTAPATEESMTPAAPQSTPRDEVSGEPVPSG